MRRTRLGKSVWVGTVLSAILMFAAGARADSDSAVFSISPNEFRAGGSATALLDVCLRDNSTGNLLQWNSVTGQYKFTRCSDGFMLTGTGTVGLVNGIRTLTDFKTDRRLSAGFNSSQLNGNATIYVQAAQGVWQLFRISETIPTPCLCLLN